MYRAYVNSIIGNRGFNPLFEADKGGGGGAGEGGSDDKGGKGGEGGNGDDSDNFDEMLKSDPKFKDWYTKKFGSDFSQRTKKLRDDQGNLIDADEYWKLKQAEEEKKRQNETEADKIKRERDEALAKVANVEKAEKRIAVKEHAIDKGYDSKLVARLMETELDSITVKDGKYEGITEAIDRLAEEFPQIKAQTGNGGGNEGGEGNDGGSGGSYNAGDSRQRQNSGTKPNRYNKGAERAKARHAKQS
jgi:hypothetical protein